MREELEREVCKFIIDYSNREDVETKWKKPIITYAKATDEDFLKLKEIVSPTHALPRDLLQEGETVVAYFIPFEDEVVKSNIKGRDASRTWAIAYIETNQLIKDLNTYIQKVLEEKGYKSNIIPATHNFDEEKLISDWSHRHVAYVAGLGTFGLNNMLITEKGCCGRIGTFVTDVKIQESKKTEGENCLYKVNGGCMVCASRCVNDALKEDSFNRHKCYEMCLYNDKVHSALGKSDVCGKCLVGLPCSTKNPVKGRK